MIADRLTQGRSQAAGRSFTISLSTYSTHLTIFPVLLLTTLLDFWSLSRVGYGNSYYAAAVKSMMQNWHAFFFNSLDPTGFVSIDKPPLGFWLQVASAKVFGFNGIALMLPQALAGVCSVALLYYLVGRSFGKPAGLLAALVLAITPISVVANRNNIVDSTLVLAVLLGAWAVSRAVETGRLRWLLLCALFVGLGFNIKMLEAYLVLPAFGLVYLVGAHTGWKRRIVHLFAAGLVLFVISFSWVAAVDLTPTSQRPWVGSTSTNSELSLAIGYNGVQRLLGRTTSGNGGTSGSAGPAGNGGGPGGVQENGSTGPLRLLDSQLGGQIGWLLPLAVLGFFAAAWQTRRRLWPLDQRQSGLILWGSWLATMGVFFSIAGFYHTYYLVMVAPAIAALAGIGVVSLWRAYRQSDSRIWWLLPAGLLAVAGVQVRLLADYPAWSHWLTPLIVGASVVGALIVTFLHFRPRTGLSFTLPALLLILLGLLAAPTVWSIDTVNASNNEMLPRAGPSSSTGAGGFGGFPAGGPGNALRMQGSSPPPSGIRPFGNPPIGAVDGRPAGGPGGGGPGGSNSANKGLVTYLTVRQGTASYLFATESAGAAEPYIIATGKAVMALGGFSGADPILTTAKLAALVKQGTVRYFLLDGSGRAGGPGHGTSVAMTWVQSNCSVVPASRYSSSTAGSGSNSGQQLYVCGSAT